MSNHEFSTIAIPDYSWWWFGNKVISEEADLV